MLKKIGLSAAIAATLSGLVAASFMADSQRFGHTSPMAFVLPALMVAGLGTLVAAAFWAVR